MPLMRPEDYPSQRPVADYARAYHEEAFRRAAMLDGENHFYGADKYQSIGLFRPKVPNGSVLAFMHGGAWASGYKEWMAFMAPAFTAQGVTFATIGYRLMPTHRWPVGFEDCGAAIAWLHANAGTNGTTPRIFVGGHSAGGHYAALLAVMHDWQAKQDLPADVIRGCLPISGVFQLSAQPQGPESPLSPVWAIQGNPPPFLITVGEHDPPNIIHNGHTMAGALKDAGGAVETLVLKDCDHLATSVISGEANGPWAPRAQAFMAAH